MSKDKECPEPVLLKIGSGNKANYYEPVVSRVARFRFLFPDYSMTTELIDLCEHRVIMKTIICNFDGQELASGFAGEEFSSSFINKTSAIENCETSSWGRALANLGVNASGNIASADEINNAKLNQDTTKKNGTATKNKVKDELVLTKEARDDFINQVRVYMGNEPTWAEKVFDHFSTEEKPMSKIENMTDAQLVITQGRIPVKEEK